MHVSVRPFVYALAAAAGAVALTVIDKPAGAESRNRPKRDPDAIIRENPAFTGPDGGNSTFFFSDSSYDDDDQDGFNSPLSPFITPPDTDPASEHPNFFGTSASAPHAAAVAALMLQKNSTLTPAQVRQILQDTAHGAIDKRFTSARPAELNPITLIDGYNFDAGTGLVDAVDALDAVP